MIREVFVRSPYNYDVDAASDESGQFNDLPSLTQQEFTEECDINTIVRNFGVTGQMPNAIRMPEYGDFTGIGDFKTAVEAIRMAEESFMKLDASVRKRFDNDPQQFLLFCVDDKNAAEAAKLGLLSSEAMARLKAVEGQPVPIVEPKPV